ncbi:MAG: hypothetical protein AAFZ92_01785 [Pseudomonadota bacterium]
MGIAIHRRIYLACKIVFVGTLASFIVACGSGGTNDNADPLGALCLFADCDTGSSESDPLAVDRPIAYVKRSVPTDNNGNVDSDNILAPDTFNGGAALYIKDRASRSAPEINITDAAFGTGAIYDVKDVEVAFNGSSLLFAMRPPQDPNLDADDPAQPTWSIWQYDLDNNSLAPVITDAIKREEGHDISPDYLADGRIVFSSNRQVRSRAVLLDEIKPPTSLNGAGFSATVEGEEIFNLHIIDPDNDPIGANIQQITFNQGHDLQASVLPGGDIAFLRYDASDNRDNLSLYTINSDGSNLRILYGYHSQETGNSSGNQTTFIDMREQPDGSLVGILQERDSDNLGGDLIRIDSNGFTDINQPTHDNRGDTGPGQRSLSVGSVNLDGGISIHGYFNAVYPLADSGRYLVSWDLCRLQDPTTNSILACTSSNLADPNLEAAPPAYGIWLYDTNDGTQTPVANAVEGQMYSDVVIVEPRLTPPLSVADPDTFDSDLASNGLAVLNIRSVYDEDGTDTSTLGISALADPAQTTASQRPARFLRIIKAVSQPSDEVRDIDNSAFGLNQQRGMREIVGYVPIEPDGSVKAQVPADIAFHFDVVNADGERITPLHRNWLHLKAGETYQCKGCHIEGSELPHGRDGDVNSLNQPIYSAEAPSVNPGAAQTGIPFTNTQIFLVDAGDSMADAFAKFNSGARSLSTGMVYTDDWTDPAVRTPDADYNLLYTGDVNFAGMTTDAPASPGCQTSWQASCRTVINYEDVIQPLWDTTRPDGMGGDNRCTVCHNRQDDMANLQTPAGQLELTSSPSTAEPLHMVSYRELLQADTPIIVGADGNIQTLYVLNGAVYLDADNNPILDAGGNPIAEIRVFIPGADNVNDIRVQSFTGAVADVYEDAMAMPILDAGGNTIPLTVAIDPSNIPPPPSMNLSNARNSSFFDKMENTAGTVDHSAFMSPNELRLLREWLDIGGQYYNNPFDAPLN